MKYIKKVSVAQLQSNTGTIIDSMNSGDDPTTNAPSIHAIKTYVDRKERKSLYSVYNTNQTSTSTTMRAYGNALTVTTTGKPLIVIMTSAGYVTGGNIYWGLCVDDTIVDNTIMTTNATTMQRVVGFKILNNLSAGTHTLQLGLACGNANTTATVAAWQNNSILAFEI